MFNIAPRRLRYWQRTALVRPSSGQTSNPEFVFADLRCIKTVLALLDRGVPLRRIRRSVEALRERVPELNRPLGALRVWSEGSTRMVVQHLDGLLQPDGQMVLDFAPRAHLGPDVTSLERARPAPASDGGDSAAEWFEKGCQLDADPKTYAEAIEAYRRAIEIDPTFADAHCNLGTIYFNQRQRERARTCFERALQFEARHLEANFNLASLLEERGDCDAALRHYRAVLCADPLYAEAHVNLALLCERMEMAGRARDHWRRYLQLEPAGTWADIARKHLSAKPA